MNRQPLNHDRQALSAAVRRGDRELARRLTKRVFEAQMRLYAPAEPKKEGNP